MAAQNFYKKDGSYYLVGSNQKILNLQQLQQYASGGGKEVSYTPPSAPTPPQGSVAIPAGQISNYNVTGQFGQTGQAGSGLWGTPINNNISSNTLQTGMQSGNISSQLPPTTASTIAEVEAKNAQNFSQGATGMLSIFQQQQKEAEAKIKEATDKLAALDAQQKEQVTDKYDELSTPFRKEMEDQGNIKYQLEEKYQKYSALASSLATMSEIAYNDIVAEKNRPALLSISTGRTNAIKEDYNSKIALTQTAMAALSDDITMGRTFIDRGIAAVVADRTDRLNFLEFVNGLITEQKKDAKASLLSFTKDEKDAIENQIATLQSEFTRIDEEKEKVQEFLLGNSELALKAGVSLAEPYDTMVDKVSSFIKKNPQYSEQNVDVLNTYIKQYPDAGITFNDTLEQAQAKILRSPEYKKSVRIGGSGGSGSGGFTAQEKRKLQQKGLEDAPYQEQLNFLYGEQSQDVEFYVQEYLNGNPNIVDEAGNINFSSIPADLRNDFFIRLEEELASLEQESWEPNVSFFDVVKELPGAASQVYQSAKSGFKKFLDLF